MKNPIEKRVIIFKPTRTSMQSGGAHFLKKWVMLFEEQSPVHREPLMGWESSDQTQGQIRMLFSSKEEAVSFAVRNDIPYIIRSCCAHLTTIKPKSYQANYASYRKEAWTH